MSLIVVSANKHRAVMSADSRGMNGAVVRGNDFEKIFAAGQHTVVGINGQLDLTASGLRASTVIGEMCRRRALQDKPLDFLRAVEREIVPYLKELYRHNPLPPEGDFVFTVCVLKRAPWGVVELREVRMFGKNGVLECERLTHHVGQIDRRFVWNSSFHQPKSAQHINPEEPDDMVLAAIDTCYSDSAEAARGSDAVSPIGPASAVCAIEPGGIRWIRKPTARKGLLAALRERFGIAA
jgi:hypothetical protein